jgi:transposase
MRRPNNWHPQAAWQGKELLRAVYAADDLAHARAALERFYRWADGVRLAELSRLARTVRAWEAEILAFHTTGGLWGTQTSTQPVSCQFASIMAR